MQALDPQLAAKLDLCWWRVAKYSLQHRLPLRALAPTELATICAAEVAERSRGLIGVRPLASFLCESLRELGQPLNYEEAVRRLRTLLPNALDEDPEIDEAPSEGTSPPSTTT